MITIGRHHHWLSKLDPRAPFWFLRAVWHMAVGDWLTTSTYGAGDGCVVREILHLKNGSTVRIG